LKEDLAHITRSARTPHGYTLAIWAAGMLCIGHVGLPDVTGVLLFTLGATASFGALQFALRVTSGGGQPHHPNLQAALSAVHFVALPGAVAVSWLLAALPAPWCWIACSSSATVVFVVLHGGQDALWRRWSWRRRDAKVSTATDY
jgi:hypothetical protein